MNTVRNILLALCLFLGTVAWAADNSAPRLAGEGVAGRVPAWFVALPESVSNVLIADTGASTLYRYERQGANFTRVDSRYMSVGSLGVGKQMAWDRKTPLGVYFITHELDTSRLPAKYGVAAYPLDYPNAWDLYRKRTGDGIWLHGVDPAGGQRPALDTDGCLALPNDEILSLAAVLRPLITPVIVTRNMRWVEPAELAMTRSDLLRAIEAWRVSAERSDLVGHLGLYADSFRYRDMDKALWSEYKQGVFAGRQLRSVAIDGVLLIEDPEESGLFVSRFSQVVDTGSAVMKITKRLYWRRSASDGWQIVTEDTG